ncbi:MAG: YhjD/YihY/BrkB family envelope integrity protein [Acidimicrobiia bacterium]
MQIATRLDRARHDAREVQRRFNAIRGGNLAAAISMRAFLALFPIALLAIACVGFAGGNPQRVAHDIADALGLGDGLGTTLTHVVQSAQRRRVESSIVGLLGLVWTGTGLTLSVNAAWDEAWSIRGGAWRGRAAGAVWLVGGLAFLAIIVGTAVLLRQAGILLQFGIVGEIAADALFFYWTAIVLPARKIPRRAMRFSAVVAGIGLETLKVIGSLLVPALVLRSSSLYGALGAVFAVLVWLLVLGRLIVYTALLERVRWDTRQVTD